MILATESCPFLLALSPLLCGALHCIRSLCRLSKELHPPSHVKVAREKTVLFRKLQSGAFSHGTLLHAVYPESNRKDCIFCSANNTLYQVIRECGRNPSIPPINGPNVERLEAKMTSLSLEDESDVWWTGPSCQPRPTATWTRDTNHLGRICRVALYWIPFIPPLSTPSFLQIVHNGMFSPTWICLGDSGMAFLNPAVTPTAQVKKKS